MWKASPCAKPRSRWRHRRRSPRVYGPGRRLRSGNPRKRAHCAAQRRSAGAKARRRSSDPTPSPPHPPRSTPPRLLLRSPACSIHPRPLPAAPRPLGQFLKGEENTIPCNHSQNSLAIHHQRPHPSLLNTKGHPSPTLLLLLRRCYKFKLHNHESATSSPTASCSKPSPTPPSSSSYDYGR